MPRQAICSPWQSCLPRSAASSVLAGPGLAGRRHRERLRQTFARRVNGLPGRALRALVAVTYQAEDLTAISAACARTGTHASLLGCVRARWLVQIGEGRLAFGHPLIRGAGYNGASAEPRAARSLA